ncbi:MAG: AmmeMemoRadiSam system protein B [Chloroflexota bacterium]
MANIRRPAVAGMFYPASPDALRRQIEASFLHTLGPGQVPVANAEGPHNLLGLVSPHAGYVYSGPVAAHAFAALAADGAPEVAVIIGPSHYGFGPAVAVSNADGWQTPLGISPVNREVAQAIASAMPEKALSDGAHEREHSLEVQLPFLQYLFGEKVGIVPIVMAEQNLARAQELGNAIANALAGREAVVIASTDMSHYAPQDVAVANDRLVLAAIEDWQPDRLLQLAPYQVSACGPGPVAAAMIACQQLGARSARLLKYATSGDASGDTRRVVGYAALAISR